MKLFTVTNGMGTSVIIHPSSASPDSECLVVFRVGLKALFGVLLRGSTDRYDGKDTGVVVGVPVARGAVVDSDLVTSGFLHLSSSCTFVADAVTRRTEREATPLFTGGAVLAVV